LEELIQSVGNPVELLRHSQIGPYVYPVVPPEFTNWRDEVRGWMETCALFDQSYHMTHMYVRGPDAFKLLSELAVNTLKNFRPGRAKQLVVCNYDGYVIGDAILFYLDHEEFNIVGRPSAHNWVQYHAEKSGYDVTVERDERAAVNPTGRRKVYRYQVQGPNAMELLTKLNGGPLPEIPFFHMDWITIAGRKVRALHHGMAGVPGLELFGPWEEREEVKAAIVEAGRDFGLRQVGSRAYATNGVESGWIPCPLPAVYTGDAMKPYREWLPADGYEATGSLGGSFYSDNIEDYYLTPYDLGYGRIVRFDHDFIGREALEKMADRPHRKKVTLVWNPEDVLKAMATMFEKGDPAKYINLPLPNYATWPYDRIMKDGKVVGFSTFAGYSFNERKMLSLSMIDPEYSEPGTQVTVVWGEEGGGSRKPVVERHVQVEIRATVGPAPFTQQAQNYRPRSRTS